MELPTPTSHGFSSTTLSPSFLPHHYIFPHTGRQALGEAGRGCFHSPSLTRHCFPCSLSHFSHLTPSHIPLSLTFLFLTIYSWFLTHIYYKLLILFGIYILSLETDTRILCSSLGGPCVLWVWTFKRNMYFLHTLPTSSHISSPSCLLHHTIYMSLSIYMLPALPCPLTLPYISHLHTTSHLSSPVCLFGVYFYT